MIPAPPESIEPASIEPASIEPASIERESIERAGRHDSDGRLWRMITSPTWDHDFARRSPMFAPLRALADKLPEIGWPNVEVLNHVADETGRRIVNARGQRIRFVTADQDRGARFEPRTWLTGEVQVRRIDWHDLLNALTWITYPTAKASINGRHQAALEAAADDAERGQGAPSRADSPRSPVRDALTHFDEDGVVVLCSQPDLSQLLRGFAWKDLFWQRRAQVHRSMRFFVFGHGLYHKALAPFVGMTGKALLFQVAPAVLERDADALRLEVDRLTALRVWNPERMLRPRELCPLPVLGVPGWWDASEDAGFYDDVNYFRPGRFPRKRRPAPAAGLAGRSQPRGER